MKYYFADNQTYNAADVKNAFGALVAKGGVAINLSDGEDYDPSALNQIIGSAVASGVVPEDNTSLRLTRNGGVYSISPGMAVFSDGGIVEIEEDTAVEISGGMYLYLAYSSALGNAHILVTSSAQTEGDGVLLIPIAYVNADGTVKDMRTYAQGKIPALPSATWNTLREVEFTVDTSSLSTSGGYVEATHEIDGDMNFLLFRDSSVMSTMDITDDGAEYSYIFRSSSSNSGKGDEFLCVGYSGNGLFRASYMGHGTGYLKLRYYFPKAFSGGKYTYKALVGIIAK